MDTTTVRHTLLAVLLPITSSAIAQTAAVASIDGAACAQLKATTITPAQIGEPVAKVVIDSANWVEAAPAHCRIDGHLDPVDTSATARPI